MLTPDQAAIIKGLLARGDRQQDIAAFFATNSGRVAEINKGKIFPEVLPAPRHALPSPRLMGNGYAAFIAYQALEVLETTVRTARDRILALHPDLDTGAGH